jgi:hypothetical protein
VYNSNASSCTSHVIRDQSHDHHTATWRTIDSLLSEQRSQLERLLDLYLAGAFDKQHLTDRKMRFEKTIESLEVERNTLMRQVKQVALTERDIQTLQEFGDKIRATLGSEALKTFTAKSYIIDLLDVRARVAIEDGCRVPMYLVQLRRASFVSITTTQLAHVLHLRLAESRRAAHVHLQRSRR